MGYRRLQCLILPCRTLCKHTASLPGRLWSTISSSSVIYIPVPLYGGNEKGNLFCFPFNCISPDTLTYIISISQKKRIFSLSYLKMKFQEKVSTPSALFMKNNVYTLRGEDEKQEQLFSSAREGHCSFWKKALMDIIQQNLWWSFQKPVQAIGGGFCMLSSRLQAQSTD